MIPQSLDAPQTAKFGINSGDSIQVHVVNIIFRVIHLIFQLMRMLTSEFICLLRQPHHILIKARGGVAHFIQPQFESFH